MNSDNNQYYQKSRPTPSINIGAATILVIFIVLCLITFATLSLVSANADYRLCQKVTNRTTAYYNAVSLANEQLAEMTVQPRLTSEIADFLVPINAEQNIHVIAMLPASGSNESVNIYSFRVENVGEEEQFDIETQ